MTANDILQKLENRYILVVGDVMLDRYLTGTVSRISPEAPVPVVLFEQTVDHLGGAANVALNIHALGSKPILCSVIGDDPEGQALQCMLPGAGIHPEGLVLSAERRTTVKTRVLGNHQQMLRIDREDTHELPAREAEILVQKALGLLDQFPIAAVIFQDYNKGVLTPAVIAAISAQARQRGILTAVDPKKANFFAYQKVDLFKPNLKEVRDNTPFPVQPDLESLRHAAGFLRQNLQNRITMITLSEKGLFLEEEGGARIYPTHARNIADVSGAGDTVISIATLGLAAGLEWDVLATLCNLGGGQVCEYPAVVPVQQDILKAEFENWLIQHK